jgi:hypothetical protein
MFSLVIRIILLIAITCYRGSKLLQSNSSKVFDDASEEQIYLLSFSSFSIHSKHFSNNTNNEI